MSLMEDQCLLCQVVGLGNDNLAEDSKRRVSILPGASQIGIYLVIHILKLQ